jgi:hypothetical protein
VRLCELSRDSAAKFLKNIPLDTQNELYSYCLQVGKPYIFPTEPIIKDELTAESFLKCESSPLYRWDSDEKVITAIEVFLRELEEREMSDQRNYISALFEYIRKNNAIELLVEKLSQFLGNGQNLSQNVRFEYIAQYLNNVPRVVLSHDAVKRSFWSFVSDDVSDNNLSGLRSIADQMGASEYFDELIMSKIKNIIGSHNQILAVHAGLSGIDYANICSCSRAVDYLQKYLNRTEKYLDKLSNDELSAIEEMASRISMPQAFAESISTAKRQQQERRWLSNASNEELFLRTMKNDDKSLKMLIENSEANLPAFVHDFFADKSEEVRFKNIQALSFRILDTNRDQENMSHKLTDEYFRQILQERKGRKKWLLEPTLVGDRVMFKMHKAKKNIGKIAAIAAALIIVLAICIALFLPQSPFNLYGNYADDEMQQPTDNTSSDSVGTNSGDEVNTSSSRGEDSPSIGDPPKNSGLDGSMDDIDPSTKNPSEMKDDSENQPSSVDTKKQSGSVKEFE